MVLADVRIDPCENILLEGQEDHVLVYHEIAVVLREGETGGNYLFGVKMSFLRVIGLFEFGDVLVFEVVSPYLLAVWFSFAENDFRGAFNNPFLSFLIELSLFL